jgi:hypothetical protein
MTAAVASNLLDTREMAVVHSLFRREVPLAGDLVRRVEPGDTRRSGIVGSHLELVGRVLHHHHVTEDELLWPLLLGRVTNEAAEVITAMEAQHLGIDAAWRRIEPLRSRWTVGADGADREQLADLYDHLATLLVAHLDAEETHLLPVAAALLTQQEWDALGEAGRRGAEGSERSLVFGMMAYGGDPEAVAQMLASAPPPVRVLVPRLARRAFRRHALVVHGTATP